MSRFLIEHYYAEVEKIIHYGGSSKETSIRVAFQNLLNEYCKKKDCILIPELDYLTKKGKHIRPDGTVKDSLRLDWGYWESKDEADDIDVEIQKKFDKGYPNDNILFEDSKTALLYQGGIAVERIDMDDPGALEKILNEFIGYEKPEVRDFREAIEKFKDDIPTVADALRELIAEQAKTNKKYMKARDVFLQLCRDVINPDMAVEDVREMLVQHILTEDIFNTVFDETQFHRENNIAKQLEKVLDTFFYGKAKRDFLQKVHHYYSIIKSKASGIANHSEKQKFLKVIYENFYKAYSPKKADRLGVVYTPNEIVRFMIESADHLCYKHFGKMLQDENVEILDPATGTGTYITEL
ncbi:N-6 DNA methylase, partial [Bacteroidota bacterium]